jgi:head-tail adaptor
MAAQDVAIRKRQQIANANRMMFMWVAVISAVVGIAIVVSLFLLQKAWFNEKVLAEKSKTASTLVHNNEVIGQLKDEVRVLNTNDALKSAMAPGESEPVQVVLDALPSEANSSAFGSSLQEKFLNDPALTIESLNVDPVAGVESQSDSNVQDASTTASTSENQITFRFSVSTDVNNASVLKKLLQKLERSIRAIDITTLAIETQGTKLVLTVDGHAFYEPAKTVELKDKTVKP